MRCYFLIIIKVFTTFYVASCIKVGYYIFKKYISTNFNFNYAVNEKNRITCGYRIFGYLECVDLSLQRFYCMWKNFAVVCTVKWLLVKLLWNLYLLSQLVIKNFPCTNYLMIFRQFTKFATFSVSQFE